jgi:pyridoxine 4-dehydrogenase
MKRSMNWDQIGTVAFSNKAVVRRVGFGGAWLTGPGTYGPPTDLDMARGILRHAVGRGIQLIDTADCYGPEISELLVAEALHPYPEDVLISTKGGRLALGNDRWRANGTPAHLVEACEGSLRRLRLETIDLYQLNALDPNVPLEESVGALVELQRLGKIRHIGLCNVDTKELSRAQAVAKIASVQDRYDLLNRFNDPVLEKCAQQQVAFMAWFPPSNELQARGDSALARVAAFHAARPSQIALAWLLTRAPIVVPLPGTVDPDWFEQDLAAFEIALSGNDLQDLDIDL